MPFINPFLPRSMGMTVLPPDVTVEDLLPHRGRMLLIDEMILIDKDRAVAGALVSDQWPPGESGAASPLMIIELVAQTSGVGNGLNLIKAHGKGADNRGWIVGVKKAGFYIDLLPLGAKIVVESKNRFKFDDFIEIEGSAKMDGKLIGEVVLQVMKAAPNQAPV
jgi:predicted hotdog family 3-hydroxylacyl-ACP dehydratase